MAEPTAAQKASFEKWLASREKRKGNNKAKRIAIKALIEAHQDEYDKLYAAAGGTKAK